MTYPNRPLTTSTEQRIYDSDHSDREFNDHLNWRAIMAGLVTAISSQLLLNALGAALGLSYLANSGAPRTDSGGLLESLGIWSIISLFISLFLGGWIAARTCGFINRRTATLNALILWATTMAVSTWLFANGVPGTFGMTSDNGNNVTNQSQQSSFAIPDSDTNLSSVNAQETPDLQTTPRLSAQETRNVAGDNAKDGWRYTFGTIFGLVAATIGANGGTRKGRTYNNHNAQQES